MLLVQGDSVLEPPHQVCDLYLMHILAIVFCRVWEGGVLRSILNAY